MPVVRPRSSHVCSVLVFCVAVIGLLFGPVAARRSNSEELLTNQKVVDMVKGGLPESVIIMKIRGTAANFDVSADALLKLKAEKVPDKVIEALLAVGAPAQSAGQQPPSPPPGPPLAPPPTPQPAPQPGPNVTHKIAPTPYGQIAKERPPIYQVVAGKYVELEASVGEIQINRSPFDSKVEFVLGGAKAAYRISDRQPVFFSSYTSAEAPLVKLKPGEKDRNLKIASGGSFRWGGWGSSSERRGVRAEDKIDVHTERDQSGYYRITPRQPLPPGEYGFVLTDEIAGKASGKIWDFGVD
jgi:hypothetical protein